MIKFKNVEFNEYLNGFVVTLSDERIVQVQFEIEENCLSADFGMYSALIDETNDYGLDLSDEEKEMFLVELKNNKEVKSYLDVLNK